MRGPSKELRRVIRALRDRGLDVECARSGHMKVYRAGRLITSFSATPGDTGWRNVLEQYLRHTGVLAVGEKLPR